MASYLENILIGKQYTAIELFSLSNEDRFAFLQVLRKKNEIAISKSEIFNTIESLAVEKTKTPVVLVINNSQVLFKEVIGVDVNDRKLLQKVFPNLQIEEFYYEIWRKETVSIISICRKMYVEEMVKSLGQNFKIFSISLGVSSVSNLIAVSEIPEISTNTQKLLLSAEENIITTVASYQNTVTYSVNGLEINSNYIIGFAGILSLLFPIATTGNINNYNALLSEAFKQKTFFEKGLKTGLAIILGILLINFLLFSHYFDKVAAMKQTISLSRAGIENTLKLREQIKDKEKRLESFTGNTDDRTALLLNEIAEKIPSSILLNEIEFYPLGKKIKPEEKVITENKFVIVSGTILSNEAFTNWVESIAKIKKVEKVVISDFGKDQENNTAFTLKITIKENETQQKK